MKKILIFFYFLILFLNIPHAQSEEKITVNTLMKEGYKLIILDTKENKGTSTKLSKSWSEAVDAFNKAADTENAILILTHSNKRWYKVSGKKNPNGLYTDAFAALADYVQSFGNYIGPLMSEKDAEFYMEEDAETSWKDKF